MHKGLYARSLLHELSWSAKWDILILRTLLQVFGVRTIEHPSTHVYKDCASSSGNIRRGREDGSQAPGTGVASLLHNSKHCIFAWCWRSNFSTSMTNVGVYENRGLDPQMVGCPYKKDPNKAPHCKKKKASQHCPRKRRAGLHFESLDLYRIQVSFET